MVTAEELEHILGEKIPLTQHMGIRVESLDENGVVLSAPLVPNINDKGTAFAGSLDTLLVLSGWGLLRARLDDRAPRIAVVESHITYSQPVTDSIRAVCPTPATEALQALLRDLDQQGKARIAMNASVACDGKVAVTMTAEYTVSAPRVG